jgi:hypothetical protein
MRRQRVLSPHGAAATARQAERIRPTAANLRCVTYQQLHRLVANVPILVNLPSSG